MNGSMNNRPFRMLVTHLKFGMNILNASQRMNETDAVELSMARGVPVERPGLTGGYSKLFSCMIYNSTEKWSLTEAVIIAPDGVVITTDL